MPSVSYQPLRRLLNQSPMVRARSEKKMFRTTRNAAKVFAWAWLLLDVLPSRQFGDQVDHLPMYRRTPVPQFIERVILR